MLHLNLKKEPYWLELPSNVRVFVRPLTTAIMSASQNSVIKEIAAVREKNTDDANSAASGSGDNRANIDIKNEEGRLGLSESLLIKALARYSIIRWEGVMLPNDDKIAPVNDATINDLMDIWFIAQDFWKKYSEGILNLEIEGNALGPDANGTTAAGPVIAMDAASSSSLVAGEKKA